MTSYYITLLFLEEKVTEKYYAILSYGLMVFPSFFVVYYMILWVVDASGACGFFQKGLRGCLEVTLALGSIESGGWFRV